MIVAILTVCDIILISSDKLHYNTTYLSLHYTTGHGRRLGPGFGDQQISYQEFFYFSSRMTLIRPKFSAKILDDFILFLSHFMDRWNVPEMQ